MATMERVAFRHRNRAHAGMQKSLQQEWDFVQHVIPGVGEEFHPAKEALQCSFLMYLFYSAMDIKPLKGVTLTLVKQAGQNITNPTMSTSDYWFPSFVITVHLVGALRGRKEFWMGDHALLLK